MSTLPGISASEVENYLIDSEKLIVVGHSSGGHGAWWFASHYPDRVIAGKTALTEPFQLLVL
jgi:predicted peptidase